MIKHIANPPFMCACGVRRGLYSKTDANAAAAVVDAQQTSERHLHTHTSYVCSRVLVVYDTHDAVMIVNLCACVRACVRVRWPAVLSSVFACVCAPSVQTHVRVDTRRRDYIRNRADTAAIYPDMRCWFLGCPVWVRLRCCGFYMLYRHHSIRYSDNWPF